MLACSLAASTSVVEETPPLRVLITGVTGMIGSNVAAVLLERRPLAGVPLPPMRIFGLARFRSDMRMFQALVSQESKITLLRGDLDDPLSISIAVRKSMPDVVYHFGGQAYNGVSWGAPSLTIRSNVIGTVNLLEALRANNLARSVRVLMAASSAQYGAGIQALADPHAPFPETTPQLPLSQYGVSKAAMELLGRQYGANYGIRIMYARLFPQVGLGQSEELAMQSFARQVVLAERGVQPHVLVGNLTTLRDYSDVEESAVGLAHLALRGEPGEAYNFASGSAHRMGDVLQLMIAQSKRCGCTRAVRCHRLRPVCSSCAALTPPRCSYPRQKRRSPTRCVAIACERRAAAVGQRHQGLAAAQLVADARPAPHRPAHPAVLASEASPAAQGYQTRRDHDGKGAKGRCQATRRLGGALGCAKREAHRPRSCRCV